MSRTLAGILVLALLVLLAPACGREAPRVPAHGLVVETFTSEPTGEPVPIADAVGPGAWIAHVSESWTVTEDGRPPREGEARLTLRRETRRIGERLSSRILVRVEVARGAAEGLEDELDGIEITVEHDAHGRPRFDTLRFGERAPARARRLFAGLGLCGFAGGAPWTGPESARPGEAWLLPANAAGSLVGVAGPGEIPPVVAHGGARLVAVDDAGGERRLEIALSHLVEVTGPLTRDGRQGAMSLGIASTGRATVRARDGVPLTWTMEQRSRFHAATGDSDRRLVLDHRVHGQVREVALDAD